MKNCVHTATYRVRKMGERIDLEEKIEAQVEMSGGQLDGVIWSSEEPKWHVNSSSEK